MLVRPRSCSTRRCSLKNSRRERDLSAEREFQSRLETYYGRDKPNFRAQTKKLEEIDQKLKQHRAALSMADEHKMSLTRRADFMAPHQLAVTKLERERAAVETGPRGGRYHVSSTGMKIYERSNPGPVVVGHLKNQRFVGGLPLSAHLNEPRRK